MLGIKRKVLLALLFTLLLVAGAVVAVIAFASKEIVYESNDMTGMKCIIKNDEIAFSFNHYEEYSKQTLTFNGKFKTNGNYYRVNVDDTCSSYSFFGENIMDVNIPSCMSFTGIINDKIIYNPIHNDYLVKKGVTLTDDEIVAIYSDYRANNATDIDLFVELTATLSVDDVKYDIATTLYKLTGDLEEELLITGGSSAINSISEDGTPFAVAEGRHNITVTYDTDKTIDMLILIGENKDDDAQKKLSVKDNSLIYDLDEEHRLEKGTTKEQFILNKEVKLALDAEYVPLTVDMLGNFDTSKTGALHYTVTYQGVTERGLAHVYDTSNDAAEIIDILPLISIKEKGQDLTFSLKVQYDNAPALVEELVSQDAEGVKVKGYDKNKTGIQFITIEYKGSRIKQIVIVRDETFNPEIGIKNAATHINILDGQIDGAPTIKFERADGTITEPFAITLDMLQNFDVNAKKDGYYYAIYKTALGDCYFEVDITFLNGPM